MSKDSHKIVATWEKIAEYCQPHKEQTLRKTFGPEMKELGVVFKGQSPGKIAKRTVIWSVVWQLEEYVRMKAKRGEWYRTKGKGGLPW